VLRKPSRRPTENCCANVAPLRPKRNFRDNDSRFITTRILKRNVKIAVCFHFHSNHAACERKPVLFTPGALRVLSQMYVCAGPTEYV
jgi:hypothetical protein